MPIMDFEQALALSGNSDRSILLGNGFSIAQSADCFDYASLLGKSGLKDATVGNVFSALETVDFEEVVESLEHAARITKAYDGGTLATKFAEDAEEVRKVLISVIHALHPPTCLHIPEVERNVCGEFLAHFKKIFSLNYDLLLYWTALHAKRFSDGFGLGKKENGFHGPFKEDANCNLFYVHGALHLFLDQSRDVQKRVLDDGGSIIEAIASTINEEKRLPLFVAEGSSKQKLNKIRTVPYLNFCHKKIFELTGDLFIFGHSVNERDGHIYDAIFESKVQRIFFCVFKPKANLQYMKQRLAPFQVLNDKIDVQFVDASKMNIWGKDK